MRVQPRVRSSTPVSCPSCKCPRSAGRHVRRHRHHPPRRHAWGRSRREACSPSPCEGMRSPAHGHDRSRRVSAAEHAHAARFRHPPSSRRLRMMRGDVMRWFRAAHPCPCPCLQLQGGEGAGSPDDAGPRIRLQRSLCAHPLSRRRRCECPSRSCRGGDWSRLRLSSPSSPRILSVQATAWTTWTAWTA